jgi:hypothetical protein
MNFNEVIEKLNVVLKDSMTEVMFIFILLLRFDDENIELPRKIANDKYIIHPKFLFFYRLCIYYSNSKDKE